MNIWHDIKAERIAPTDFVAVIEISKGSNKKYELDKETGMLSLDRILFTATHYPMNYGFIPRTYGDDKDPLDVLVLCSEAIQPMTLVRCYPIGVMKMTDSGFGDEKIIAIRPMSAIKISPNCQSISLMKYSISFPFTKVWKGKKQKLMVSEALRQQ